MRKNIIYALLATLVLGLAIGLTFAFDNTALTNSTTVFTFYLITKIVFGLGFIGVIVYGMVEEPERGTFLPMVGLMLILQFIPLLMRAFIPLTKFQLGACLITLFVCLAAMVIVIGIMPGISKKQLETEEKFAAQEIEVKKDLPDKF